MPGTIGGMSDASLPLSGQEWVELEQNGRSVRLRVSELGGNELPQLTLTNTNDPDLVDTDVALRIGTATPNTSQHLELGPTTLQSKTDNTTAATLNLNSLGGDLQLGNPAQANVGITSLGEVEIDRVGGLLKFQTRLEGFNVLGDLNNDPTDFGDQDSRIIFQNAGGTDVGGVGYLDDDLNLILRSLVRNGSVSIEAFPFPAEVPIPILQGDGSLLSGTFLGDAEGLKLGTKSTGAVVRGNSNVSPGGNQNVSISFENSSGFENTVAFVGFPPASTEFRIQNLNNGGQLHIEARNAANTATRRGFSMDPDNTCLVYHPFSDDIVMFTHPNGINLASAIDNNPFLGFFQDNLATRNAVISASTSEFRIEGEVHGVPFVLAAENSGGTATTGFRFDPDAESQMFHIGLGVARTITAVTGGFEINNTLTGAGFERALTVSDLIPFNAISADVDVPGTAAVDIISIAVAANTNYAVEIGGSDSGFDTDNIQFSFSGPAGSTINIAMNYYSAAVFASNENQTLYNFTSSTSDSFSAVGYIRVGGTAGNLIFRAAKQADAGGNGSIIRGTWMRLTPQ